MTINIFGLYTQCGMPVCEALVIGYQNEAHINHIELAREQWDKWHDAGIRKHYEGIMLCLDGQGFIYNAKSFQIP